MQCTTLLAREEGGSMGIEFKIWGVIVHLNREAGCWAAQSRPELEQLLNAIPEPWGTIVRGAIAVHKLSLIHI